MNDEHVLKLLEEQPANGLSEKERTTIQSHIATCSDCLRAYQAARISAALLKARAKKTVEPSPYFGARIMAALDEDHSGPGLAALWKPVRAMVASMVVFVAMLLALTSYFNGFQTPTDVPYPPSGESLYSPERVVLGNGGLPDELTNNQVLLTLYESPRAYGDYR
jgi:hypothetical protein